MSQRRQKRIDPPTDEVAGSYEEDEQSVVSEEESDAEQSVVSSEYLCAGLALNDCYSML